MAQSHWDALMQAAVRLGNDFQTEFLQGVCRLLAAIYHLGSAGATPSPCHPVSVSRGDRSGSVPSPEEVGRGFINPTSASRAARLLGTSLEALTWAVFGSNPVSSMHSSFSSASAPGKPPSKMDQLSSFVASLYASAGDALK